MAVTFQSSALQSLYDGTDANAAATQAALVTFRTGGSADVDSDIESLDRRIATFETVLIGSTATAGKSSADYPYDREGLKREFLDETLSLLLQRSVNAGGTPSNLYSASGVLVVANPMVGPIVDPSFKGGAQTVVAKTATTGFGDFGDLNTANTTDPRLNMLNADGQAIFQSYSHLIDGVFAEGDKLANNPARSVQVVSAIQPLTLGSVTYDRTAQVSGFDTATNLPTYNTYLLQSTATDSHVVKDALGNANLTAPATSTADRLLLSPFEATLDTTTSEYTATVDGLTFRVSNGVNGINIRTDPNQSAVPADVTSPLLLNVPNRGTEFPDVRIVANYRYTASNGATYLVGLSTEGKVYVTSLAPARSAPVGTTASLSDMEYLLFYNETRVKILRAQLGYKEAIVREIQDDLKRANAALADLEAQSGAVTATDKDGQPTNQYSAETLKMSLFGATASPGGAPIFVRAGNDSFQNATEWQTNRTQLKNYIDRRSSEAQEATLDYQNTLNRFNNALEVMAKLQEKLDTLLKSQLRNVG